MTLIDHTCAVIPPDAGLLEIRSPTQVVLVPDQIIFNVNRAFIPRLPQPTKRGVYERDKGTCAYCGKWIQISAATLDHVIPLRQGGKSTWENLVNSCSRCNQRKGGRTPGGAHMKLLFRHEIPKVRLRPD
jgi:5-methylcytosine-specific restriction endonuclease McrA